MDNAAAQRSGDPTLQQSENGQQPSNTGLAGQRTSSAKEAELPTRQQPSDMGLAGQRSSPGKHVELPSSPPEGGGAKVQLDTAATGAVVAPAEQAPVAAAPGLQTSEESAPVPGDAAGRASTSQARESRGADQADSATAAASVQPAPGKEQAVGHTDSLGDAFDDLLLQAVSPARPVSAVCPWYQQE